jgi:hypothetical protein
MLPVHIAIIVDDDRDVNLALSVTLVEIKRINPDIKIYVVAEDETIKTRVLDYGAVYDKTNWN